MGCTPGWFSHWGPEGRRRRGGSYCSDYGEEGAAVLLWVRKGLGCEEEGRRRRPKQWWEKRDWLWKSSGFQWWILRFRTWVLSGFAGVWLRLRLFVSTFNINFVRRLCFIIFFLIIQVLRYGFSSEENILTLITTLISFRDVRPISHMSTSKFRKYIWFYINFSVSKICFSLFR